MSNDRRNFTNIERELLFAQVDGICPICATSLTYTKDTKVQKKYEIAHIYPLNPTKEEISLLKDEERLTDDVNSLDNLILLCTNCHTQFDKPRTIDEYRNLVAIKKHFINEQKLKKIYGDYKIEEEISNIINLLSSQELNEEISELEYSAIKIDDKLNDEFDKILKKQIKNNVSQYYNYIKMEFLHIEKVTPGKFDLIAGQIKSFYLNAKLECDNQVSIFNKVAEWLQIRIGNCSLEACKVVVSFFIQNCEVFEYVTQ